MKTDNVEITSGEYTSGAHPINNSNNRSSFIPIEEDMKKKIGKREIHINQKREWIDRIYNNNPLLGNHILSEKEKKELDKYSKEILAFYMNYPSQHRLSHDMALTLAVIYVARDWNTESNEGFWEFIARYFDYPTKYITVREICTQSIKNALRSTGRWFVQTDQGNQYKSSILVHALSTKKTWMLFLDFLFDFYKDNLDWQYKRMDPITPRMAEALKQKLLCQDMDELNLSSKVYSFQEGIRKLIIYKPGYFSRLVDRMLNRIDLLIRGEAKTAANYEEMLCDMWMQDKLSSISISKRNRFRDRSANYETVDYDRIQPRYTLDDNKKVSVRFTAARLPIADFQSLYLTVYNRKNKFLQKPLAYFGNELGRTMRPFTVQIDDLLKSPKIDNLDFRFVIQTENSVIYDSEDNMERNCLLFEGKKEVSRLKTNSDVYTALLLQGENLDGENLMIDYIESTPVFDVYTVELLPGFLCLYRDEVLAFDMVDSKKAWLVEPEILKGCCWKRNRINYSVLNKSYRVSILFEDEEAARRYRLVLNGNVVEWQSLECRKIQNRLSYSYNLSRCRSSEIHLELKDLQKEVTCAEKFYKLLPSFEYRFERAFYLDPEDIVRSHVYISTSNGCDNKKSLDITEAETEIQFPYAGGQIEIQVPWIKIRNQAGQIYELGKKHWHKEILQESYLYIDGPNTLRYSLYLGDRELYREKQGGYPLGNSMMSRSGSDLSTLSLTLVIDDLNGNRKEQKLGEYVFKEQFVKKPILSYSSETLIWNQGHGLIGDQNSVLKLIIHTVPEQTFPLNLNDQIISDNLTLPVGIYDYEIIMESGSLFSKKKILLYTGKLISGDEDQLRFEKQVIKLTNIRFMGTKHYIDLSIRPSWVENITFAGYEDFEGQRRTVYTGIMFYYDDNGKKVENSFTDMDGETGEQIMTNPVRMILIDDEIMSITNLEGDGFYYCEIGEGSYSRKRFITDWIETDLTSKYYSTVDYLVYERSE